MSEFRTMIELKLTGLPLAYVQERALRGELSEYLTRLVTRDLEFLHKFDGSQGQIFNSGTGSEVSNNIPIVDPSMVQAFMQMMQSGGFVQQTTEAAPTTETAVSEVTSETSELGPMVESKGTEETGTKPKRQIKRLNAAAMSILNGMDD
ncbi:hypothetical protein ABGV42_01760 [Paenibacillus pabuli]|uniref:hypothetical protein n=1 Tax=Paenibacillus pabuli TaxID=1472 RepID=UPI00324219C4